MGFIIVYKDHLNPIIHVFHAMCKWKQEMKNITNPLPMGGYFRHLLYIYSISASLAQYFKTRTINGSFYTVNLISEKIGCIYLFNSSYVSQGLQIKITLVMLVEYVM